MRGQWAGGAAAKGTAGKGDSEAVLPEVSQTKDKEAQDDHIPEEGLGKDADMPAEEDDVEEPGDQLQDEDLEKLRDMVLGDKKEELAQ